MQLGTSFGAGCKHRLKYDGVFTVTQPTLSLDAPKDIRDDLKFSCINPTAVLSESQDSECPGICDLWDLHHIFCVLTNIFRCCHL